MFTTPKNLPPTGVLVPTRQLWYWIEVTTQLNDHRESKLSKRKAQSLTLPDNKLKNDLLIHDWGI